MAIMYNDGFDMFDALLQILKTHFLRNAKSEQAAKKKHAKKKHKALDRRASLPFAHTRVCVCVCGTLGITRNLLILRVSSYSP